MTDPIENEASHVAELELIREELREKNQRLAEVEAELAAFRNDTKTWPPRSIAPQEEDTDDLKNRRDIAEILDEMQQMRTEFLNLSREVASLNRAVSEYTPIMDRVAEALQQEPRCADCPRRNEKPTLSVAPSSHR